MWSDTGPLPERCTLEEFCRHRHGRDRLGLDDLMASTPDPESGGSIPMLDPTTDLGDLDDGEPPLFRT